MPQSLVNSYHHITFSTKHRYPFIDKIIDKRLYAYLAGICKQLDSYSIIVGGYLDHVHILCNLSPKINLSKLVGEIKVESSKWMKGQGKHLEQFYWQKGYGAFSVNPTEIETAKNYIEKQEEHHAHRSFQDEYRAFLRKYNIPFDERYVWD